MSILLWKYALLLSVIFLTVFSSHGQELYTKFWVIEVDKGETEARRVAKDLNLIYHGVVGSLQGLYILKEGEGEDGRWDQGVNGHNRRRRDIESLYRRIAHHEKVKFVEPQVMLKRTKRDMFTDPLYANQWNLHAGNDGDCSFDINVIGSWQKNVTGRGVVVTVVDDGLEYRHPDIITNYDAKASYDYTDNDNDPSPRQTVNNYNKHGTRCAGQIASTANNGVCGVGVAYQANLGGIRMFDGSLTDSVEAASLSHNPQHVDVYSVSWGPDDDGKTVDGPRALARKAIHEGARNGRNGLGSIYVWATGNGGRNSDSCACDGFVNMIETVSISAVDYCGKVPFYAEACSGILAVTFSSGSSFVRNKKITTTDLHGKCTDAFTGTSAAAPVASGIIALALQVNKQLSWRDVQHLIVRSSNKIHPTHSSWVRNGNGLLVSDYFGFGTMDTGRLVDMAGHADWKTVTDQHICKSNVMTINKNFNVKIPTTVEHQTIACSNSETNRIKNLEHVIVKLHVVSWPRGGLEINLVSPSGTIAPILKQRAKDFVGNGFDGWPFMSVFFWDENPVGVWKLQITQQNARATVGTLRWWSLDLYGTSETKTTPVHNGTTTTSTQSPTTTKQTTSTTTDGDTTATNGGSTRTNGDSTTTLPLTTIIIITTAAVILLVILSAILMNYYQRNTVNVHINNNQVVQHRFSKNEFVVAYSNEATPNVEI